MLNMSWKRIFKTARKVGAPVIVAKEDGKHPQVILPLDIYEALIDTDYKDGGEFDEEIDIPDFDDEPDEHEIKFDDDWNEAEYMNQYRKKRAEGYTVGETHKLLDQEGWGWNNKEVEPEEAAAAAFELQEEELKKDTTEIEQDWRALAESDIEAEQLRDAITPDSSKPSEEIATEDRFYFEPLEDEGDKR